MNKFLLTGLSLLTLAACTHDLDEWQEPNNDSQYKTVYLPIQFVTTGTNVTRTGDATQEGTVAGSTDETFTTTNNLELFFFDDKGTDFDFLSKEGLNKVEDNISLTWTKQTDNTFVSNYIKVLTMDEDDALPTKIVAILNPPSTDFTDTLEDEELNTFRKTKLTGCKNYSSAVKDGEIQEDMFMMSNSVYNDGSNAVYATYIDSDNFIESGVYNAMSEAEHLEKATPIYLERVVAKVTMDYSKVQSTTVVPNSDDGNYEDGSAVSATLDVQGWSIFNILRQTYLLKDIEGYSATWAWNSPTLHRSYWAQPMTGYELGKQTLKWKTEELDDGMCLSQDFKFYPFENTLPNTYTDDNGREANTCALIAGQLKDKDGNTLQLTYWENAFYTLPDLLKAIKEKYEEEGITVGSTSDICFQISEDAPYRVVPYIKGQYATTKGMLTEALLWGDGRCYYYQPISHLSLSGMNGIVRNHWYKLTVNSLTGLGTPIPAYDKDENIIVVPTDETDPDNPSKPITSENVEVDPTRPDYPIGGDWNIKVNITVMPWVKEELDVVKFYQE
jgi:hypothetical protein